MKIVAVIAARMTSTRFPGKVLAQLGSRTVLDWVIGRVRQAKRLDEIIVATTRSASDDHVIEACRKLNLRSFRGSEMDVLGRFVEAAEYTNADWVFRINADNPFIDPTYLDRLVIEVEKELYDYVSYALGNGKPTILSSLGFFAETVSRSCLIRAEELITDPFEREHVTFGIYQRPDSFRIKFLDLPPFFDNPNLRFTLDTPNDLQLLDQIVRSINEPAFNLTAGDFVRMVEQHSEWQEAMLGENMQNPKTNRL